MGATTEFMEKEQIQAIYGKVRNIIGGGWLHLKAGQVTDDTEMMECVARAIVESGTVDEILNRCCLLLKEWYYNGPIDIGGACSRAIRRNFRKRDYKDWFDSALHVKEVSLGNGSLMRSLYAILYYFDKPNDVCIMQGRLTHNNVICDNAIRLYREAFESVSAYGYINYQANMGKCLGKRLGAPTGHVVNTLNNAIYYANNCHSIEDALVEAVNDGGDADTIAAITGGLVGFKYGFNNIPVRWIRQLNAETKEKLDYLTEKIVK
jgi:ADP-ribosyl-[dinitrogen reductase] hydrolase